MKHIIKSFSMFFVAAVVFSSCTSAYQATGTPDDVYASKEKPGDEYEVAKNKSKPVYRQYEDDEYENFEDYDDRYLRMKVKNRAQWSDLDDWYYYGDRYNFSYYNNWAYWNDPFYWNNPWSPVSYWGMYSPWGWRNYYSPWYSSSLYWGGGYYNPWYSNYWGYNSWYGYGWNSFYDPWYNGWGYYPGWGIGSTQKVNYGARGVNANTYNRGSVNRGTGLSTGRGGIANSNNSSYRNTYGVRNNASIETSTGNSGRDARMNTLRARNNTNNSNYSRSNNEYTAPARNNNSSFETRSSSSNNSSVGSSSSSSSSSSGRGGSSSGGRRF